MELEFAVFVEIQSKEVFPEIFFFVEKQKNKKISCNIFDENSDGKKPFQYFLVRQPVFFHLPRKRETKYRRHTNEPKYEEGGGEGGEKEGGREKVPSESSVKAFLG